MPSTIIDQISQLDSFAKPRDDYRTKTFFGGLCEFNFLLKLFMILVTILSGGLILLLIASEFSQYKKVIWKPELIVDTERKEKVNIEIDITFPKVPCFGKLILS